MTKAPPPHTGDLAGNAARSRTGRKAKVDSTLLPEILQFPSHFQKEEILLKDLSRTRLPYTCQRVLVLGGKPDGERIVRKLLEEPDRYDVLGIFDDRWRRLQGLHHSVPVLGNIDDMINFCRNDLPDIIIVATFDAGRERLRTMIRKIIVLPVNIYLAMDSQQADSSDEAVQDDGNIILLPLSRVPLEGRNLVFKWVEDKIFAFLFITLLSPVMLGIALLIKMDSKGPVFFIQNRYGFNNKVIKVFKFRTMHVSGTDFSGAQRTVRNDPRVTRVGRYLRNFSLDELPQFFNVLFGNMSIVGPRAHAMAMRVNDELYEKVIDCYSARHKVKPGITGLAQIMGYRGEIKTKEAAKKRIDYDLYYITHWSLWLDIKIIFKSMYIVLFKRDNAF